MRERDFAYAVARIRALETKLISDAQLDRMADAPNLAEAVALLGETEYAPALAHLQEALQFETALDAELQRVFRLVLQLSQDAPEIRLLMQRYDVENLKRILKEARLGAARLSRLGVWPPEWLLERMEAAEPELPEPYAGAVREARRLYQASGDVQEIDRILDRAWFAAGHQILGRGRSDLLREWWSAAVDLTNLRIWLRLRFIGLGFADFQRFFLEGGHWQPADFQAFGNQNDDQLLALLNRSRYSRLAGAGPLLLTSLSVLERESDNYLTELIGRAKYIALGIEPLVGYWLAKETEVRSLRIILTGQSNRVPNSKIKERLRRAYT
ncbi:V/A-type H+-transporting ATPase subunit C [Hydrogenispora ethanolica]|uniref:V/A-type H+-transporting ATPase subunit C n=1 Tax=Hydrogenispora ethanolica TaxID=1082276 RepID=A0A4R1SBK1_HYDET|nr:V-type ATPase subunit [Hydrogenispora ethanolica]TCL76933.1 V/A-type H+-transporting ATPase subunit C [Hydrogenispora ethanolica]